MILFISLPDSPLAKLSFAGLSRPKRLDLLLYGSEGLSLDQSVAVRDAVQEFARTVNKDQQ